jgi:hypothetical protein
MTSSARPTTILTDILILAAGLVTTVLSLVVVHLIGEANSDFQIMAYYAAFILPIGAIAVGVAAGSGYGVASWGTGRKVGGGLLITTFVLLALAYCGGQYVEYLGVAPHYEDGSPVGFFTFYDAVTRTIRMSMSHSKNPTGELGLFGYAFRLLELAGFVGGGLVIPIALRSKPYCDGCWRYMRTRQLALVPASVPKRKIAKKDTLAQQAFDTEMQSALESGLKQAEVLLKAGESGDAGVVRQQLEPLAEHKKETGKLPARIEVKLSSCPSCSSGIMTVSMIIGQGDKTKTEVVGRTPVTSAFVRQLT